MAASQAAVLASSTRAPPSRTRTAHLVRAVAVLLGAVRKAARNRRSTARTSWTGLDGKPAPPPPGGEIRHPPPTRMHMDWPVETIGLAVHSRADGSGSETERLHCLDAVETSKIITPCFWKWEFVLGLKLNNARFPLLIRGHGGFPGCPSGPGRG